MTKAQFRRDLRRGLGSCPLELERCADVEDYREDLLWDCYLEIRDYVEKL